MKKFCVLALMVSSCVALLPASAQNGQGTGLYNQNYGGGRVCKMHQNGLVGDAGRATYIGVGTMSQTAQGKAWNGNSALPQTNLGGTIRTPGDNLYNGQNTIRMENGAVNYKDNVMRNVMAKQAVQEQRAYEQWLRSGGPQRSRYAQMGGNFYTPGSNGGVSNYGASSGGGNYSYNNGMASYGSSYGGRR